MPCFINLPLRWVHDESAWTEWFINGRIAPEFGLDAASLALPDAWHEAHAARFREAGLPSSVHLPFMGVDPGVPDPEKAAAARRALRRGAELARIYGARHMVGHPYYRLPDQDGAIDPGWIARSLEVWPDLPMISGSPLFLENTYETSPKPLVDLLEALQAKGRSGPGIGVCFDVGHWHAFAKKKRPEELDPWLDAFEPFRMHLHLHDNDGSFDQHLGMGCGDVPFEALFARLAARAKPVTATLEPHDVEALVNSTAWLEAHGAAAKSFGWAPPRLEALPLGDIEENIKAQ